MTEEKSESGSAEEANETGGDETYYYWDEATQTYYYWDDNAQAYVGWVEYDEEGSADPSPSVESVKDVPVEPVKDVPVAPVKDLPVEPARNGSVFHESRRSASLEEILLDEARREISEGGRRSTVRKLTRKLTTVGNEMSMGEKLAALALARQQVGAGEDLSDDLIRERHRTELMIQRARETANLVGGGGRVGSGDALTSNTATASDVLSAIFDDNATATDLHQPHHRRASAPSVIVRPQPESNSGGVEKNSGGATFQRVSTRFGTSHFKDDQTAGRLAELLGKKVK